jgi:4-amino-4-deoxy-L-arabinose transferase-like glycosyltransferase
VNGDAFNPLPKREADPKDLATEDVARRFISSQRTVWFVGAVALALFLFSNFPWTLDEYDQEKQAFTSFEMVKEGHWLYQHTPTGLVATKPPLIGWISAGLFYLTRSWAIAWRLPSVVAAVALSILLFRAAENAYGKASALVALAALSLNLLSPRLASLVRTDMPLTLVVFALGFQIWNKIRKRSAWTQRDRVLFFLLLTAAMLIKGPIIYAFLLPGIVIFQLRMRKSGTFATAWPAWWPWIGSLVIFLIWVAGGILSVPEFYNQVVLREFAARFTQTIHRPQPSYFYVLHLLHKFAPWSVLMIALAVMGFRSAKIRVRDVFKQISPETFWLICWCAGGILLMSIVPSKRVDRIFPVIPPLCLLLAAQFADGRERFLDRSRQWAALALVLALLVTTEYAVARSIKDYRHRGLAMFGKEVRRQAAAEGLHYEVVGRQAPPATENSIRRKWGKTTSGPRYKDGVLLLYLERTHFVSQEDAITRWNSGAIDSVVAPKSDWPRLSQELHNVAATPRFEAATHRNIKYIFVTHGDILLAEPSPQSPP